VSVSAAFAREGVDALFVVGAWPGAFSQNWDLLLRARALDGVRWVVGCGRTGRRELPDARVVEYGGRSTVVRPDGAVHARINREERTLVADLDPDVLAEQRAFIPVLDQDS
jgi:predicted amidohydrolase